MNESDFTRDEKEILYNMRLDGVSWAEVYKELSHVKKSTLRVTYMRMKRRRLGDPIPYPEIENGGDANVEPDEEEAWSRALRRSERRKRVEDRRKNRVVRFENGPICIANMADFHAGSEGTDYERLEREIDIVNETPGMFFGLAGDLVDNYIVGRLLAVQRDEDFTISDQWAVVRYLLRKMTEQKKILWSVSGNHDDWTRAVSGVDYFSEIHKNITPETIVDRYEAEVKVEVGGISRRWVIRHKWRGNSQWNPLHAIQKAAKFNNAKPFDVGVGAHTHISGLSGFFNIGEETSVAILCGAYKRFDDYADQLGVSEKNSRTAVAIAQGEDGRFTLFDSLEAAADYMSIVYKDEEED